MLLRGAHSVSFVSTCGVLQYIHVYIYIYIYLFIIIIYIYIYILRKIVSTGFELSMFGTILAPVRFPVFDLVVGC